MGDIIFVVDGGPQEGTGHVYESVTLAGERPPGTKVEFHVPIKSEVIVEKLAGEGHSVMMVEQSAFIDSILDRDPNVIVFNLPKLKTGTVENLRDNLDARIVVYGDTETNVSPNVSKHSDVIVSSNRVIEGFAGRRRRDRHGTLRLVGPKYLVLRPKFYEYTGVYNTQTLRRIMLMFGGADPKNLTTYFVDKLVSLRKNYLIDAVVGAGFTNHEELEKVLAGESSSPSTRT
jgi:spore coat polysaccharide biosynthesis predicted glycosyltransferase SpsG